MSADYPGLPFIEAKEYGGLRPGPPKWLVFHTMEVAESPTAAEGTARYFQTLSDGRTVSSHTCVDNNSAVQCVPVNRRAWCAGNRPGNDYGIHIEQAGRAAQTAGQWQDAYSQALIRLVAKVHAIDVVRFAIPLRWLTVDQVKRGDKGFCTHNDLRLAFNVTTHWDPGPNYPKGQVLELFRAEVAALAGQPTNGDDDMFCKYGETKSYKVRYLQRRLDRLGYKDPTGQRLTLDGDYGDKTAAALKTYVPQSTDDGKDYNDWAMEVLDELLRWKTAVGGAQAAVDAHEANHPAGDGIAPGSTVVLRGTLDKVL